MRVISKPPDVTERLGWLERRVTFQWYPHLASRVRPHLPGVGQGGACKPSAKSVVIKL